MANGQCDKETKTDTVLVRCMFAKEIAHAMSILAPCSGHKVACSMSMILSWASTVMDAVPAYRILNVEIIEYL